MGKVAKKTAKKLQGDCTFNNRDAHWRRSAVNSAGALRGISGNFHPQKHTYAHFIL